MNQPIKGFNFKARVILTGIIMGVAYGVIIARGVDLMVIDGPRFREMAHRQHQRVEKLVPKRGAIVDRNGRALAESVLVDSVYAHPSQVPDPMAAASILAPILKESEDSLLKLLASDKNFVWLKRSLNPAQADAIRRNDIPGVVLTPEYARYYPEGRLAAHILGFTGTDGAGLEGMEKQYNSDLAGDEISVVVERDARGHSIYPDPDTLPNSKPGKRFVLTIDVRIQQIAEQALEEVMANSGSEYAMAAVMDVSTGKMLALAVRPTFNPNDFKKYPATAYRNRMIKDFFEPGSTFKTFTLAAFLDSSLGKLDDEFYCEDGAFEIDGSIINDTSAHSWFTVEEIIVHSSNIGAAKLGLKLGRERLGDYLGRFGFGHLTGIDLAGENSGLVRNLKKISRVGVATVAFGQGIAVTGIQLLAGINAIANGGVFVQPRVIDRVEDNDGNIVLNPQVVSRRIISAGTAHDETRALTNVIHGGGTGGRAAPSGYTAAGKTGTAQKVNTENGGYYEDKYVASFMGFVPAERPVISILVVADDPKGEPWGGTVAAPAFKKIAERVLPILGVLPETASQPLKEIIPIVETASQAGVQVSALAQGTTAAVQTSPAPAASAESCVGCMPNLAGLTLREILTTASTQGAKVEIAGSGRVIAQRPLPGTQILGDKRWWVRLAMDPY